MVVDDDGGLGEERRGKKGKQAQHAE
jgi:hypothetical protein